jgi:hypothetical protein
MTDPLTELATITGMAKQNLMFFSRNNNISYGMIKAWYLANGQMPTIAECSQLKAKANESLSGSN